MGKNILISLCVFTVIVSCLNASTIIDALVNIAELAGDDYSE
jgi:hypothetical protein